MIWTWVLTTETVHASRNMPSTSLSPVLRMEQNMDISYLVIHNILLLLLNVLRLYILLFPTCFNSFFNVLIWKQWPILIRRDAIIINTMLDQPSIYWPFIATSPLFEKVHTAPLTPFFPSVSAPLPSILPCVPVNRITHCNYIFFFPPYHGNLGFLLVPINDL